MPETCKTCRTCRWWVRSSNEEASARGQGHCRRYPPIFEEQTALNDGWPNVHFQSWCGEHTPKPKETT